MQTAIEKVMETFCMMRPLTASQTASVRADLAKFLAKQPESDEHDLTIAGLRYLRRATALPLRKAPSRRWK